MKQRGILVLALILGVAAIILVNVYVKKMEKTYNKEYEYVTVLVAKKPISPGTTLENSMLDEKRVPKEFMDANALTPKDRELVLGQTVSIGLQTGQQLSWADLGVREVEGLSGIIKEGERAITVPVTEVTGVAGLLSPNDHVDIIGTFRTPSEMKQKINVKTGEYTKQGVYESKTNTVTLLQNVTILAVGTQVGGYVEEESMNQPKGKKGPLGLESAGAAAVRRRSEKLYRTVTLLVTPLEAQILTYARSKGELSLSLRNPEDLITVEDLPQITFKDIVKPEFIIKTQKKRNRRIQIYRGKAKR